MSSDPHRSGRSIIPVLIAIGALVLLGIGVLRAQTAVADDPETEVWAHSVDDGFLAADRSGKNVLVFFTADWCGPCQAMKRAVLSRDDVITALKRDYELVKVDLTERGGPNVAVAQEHGVSGIPAFRAYSGRGRHLGSAGGMRTADEFVGWARATAH